MTGQETICPTHLVDLCTTMSHKNGEEAWNGDADEGGWHGSNIAPIRLYRGWRDEIRLCGGGDASSHSSLNLDSHDDADGDLEPGNRLLPILSDTPSWPGDIRPDQHGSGLTYLRPYPLDTEACLAGVPDCPHPADRLKSAGGL